MAWQKTLLLGRAFLGLTVMIGGRGKGVCFAGRLSFTHPAACPSASEPFLADRAMMARGAGCRAWEGRCLQNILLCSPPRNDSASPYAAWPSLAFSFPLAFTSGTPPASDPGSPPVSLCPNPHSPPPCLRFSVGMCWLPHPQQGGTHGEGCMCSESVKGMAMEERDGGGCCREAD